MVSNSDGSLQCLIRNVGLIWGDPLRINSMPLQTNGKVGGGGGRWLFPRELLMTQGFATYPHLYGYADSSFGFARTLWEQTRWNWFLDPG
jgi:hypothetical protein